MNNNIQHINPEGLLKNPAFSQVVTTQGSGKTIYISGQNSINEKREIIGKGDLHAQTIQALQNIQTALSACNATFENVVKLCIYMVQGQDLYSGFQASQKIMGGIANPPAISVLIVTGLANPDFLVEIDALAFVPE